MRRMFDQNQETMKNKNKIYHICNVSPKVIFRDEEDYLIAICRLAACAYATSTEIWAYSFMSTHFHLVVRSNNIVRFIKMFKINISSWHNNKYINDIRINIGKRELLNEGEIRTAMNYVLKNPVHHKIVNIAFKYPYSTAHIYFKEYICTDEYFEGERPIKHFQKPSDLQGRTYRKLFASHQVPDSYMVYGEKIVIPDSFVKTAIIEKLYSNARDFMYHMNKPLQEELDMFDKEDVINVAKNIGEFRVSLFGKLTDIQACKIVDEFVAPKLYTQIAPDEKTKLIKLLQQKGVDKFQIERVI